MSERVEAIVKPTLLIWARESLGLDIPAASQKLSVKPDQLRNWEQGYSRPTIKQLRKLANVYKRPLAIFYLPEPPRSFDALHDYRRLPGRTAGEESPELCLQIRRAQNRRRLALDLCEMLGEVPPSFSPTVSTSTDSEEAGSQIRSLFGISYQEQREWRTDYDAFNKWRDSLEDKGVLVFQITDVEPSEIRGFSISDTPYPVIAVNIKDTPRSRIFSMLHEFVHIMLRKGGLCDFEESRSRPPEEQRVEVFCNYVAGAAIIPKSNLLQEDLVRSQSGPSAWTDQEIEALARTYRSSRETLLRRLLILGRTTEAFYRKKRKQYQEEYEALAQQPSEGFAPPFRMALSSAGPLFSRLVLQGYHRERITSSDLSEYLNVRIKHLARIEAELFGPGRATRGHN